MMLSGFIKKLFHKGRSLYVIADSTDNSVTFSEGLYRRLDVEKLDSAKVYCFFVPDSRNYGFTVNPPIEQETQFADIMYNSKYKTIGFECLCPTVNRIFHDYGLPALAKIKLSVQERTTADGAIKFYEIQRPVTDETSRP